MHLPLTKNSGIRRTTLPSHIKSHLAITNRYAKTRGSTTSNVAFESRVLLVWNLTYFQVAFCFICLQGILQRRSGQVSETLRLGRLYRLPGNLPRFKDISFCQVSTLLFQNEKIYGWM